jgi:hypothetical protein
MADLEGNASKSHHFLSFGDKTIFDLLIALAIPLTGIIVGLFQWKIQQNQKQADIMSEYFKHLHDLERDIINKQNDDSSKKLISSIAKAKTSVVLQALDPQGKGDIIRYLHGSGISPDLLDKYDSRFKEEDPSILCKSFSGSQAAGGSQYQEVPLRNINIEKSYLQNQKLPGIDFSRSGLNEFNFEGTNLDCSKFTEASIAHSSFKNSQLRGSDFSKSYLDDVDLSGSVLTKSDFSGASIVNSSFWNSGLSGTNFSRAALVNSDLRGTDFSQAQNLDSIHTFKSSIFDCQTIFPKTASGKKAWERLEREGVHYYLTIDKRYICMPWSPQAVDQNTQKTTH